MLHSNNEYLYTQETKPKTPDAQAVYLPLPQTAVHDGVGQGSGLLVWELSFLTPDLSAKPE